MVVEHLGRCKGRPRSGFEKFHPFSVPVGKGEVVSDCFCIVFGPLEAPQGTHGRLMNMYLCRVAERVHWE